MSIHLLSSKQSLVNEIASRLKFTGRSYSSNLVVFPSKRPSYFLRKKIASQANTSFIPPLIFSMDEFVDYFHEMLYSKKKLETIDAVAILYDIHKKMPKPLGEGNFVAFDRFFPLGLKIYNDIEELFMEGIDSHKLKESVFYNKNVTIPERTSFNIQSLFYYFEEFYKSIKESGLSTRASRYKDLSDKIESAKIADILNKYNPPCKYRIFAGFYAFTSSMKVLFKKLLSLEDTIFFFQHGPGIKERLNDLDIKIKIEETDTNATNTKETNTDDLKISFYSSPDTHGQVYAISKVLEEKLKNNEVLDEKTVIVLPSSETLFPLLRQGLTLLTEKDYNISLSYPLHRTPIYTFLSCLMELITSMDEDRYYTMSYLKFVLHPYTKNIYYNRSYGFGDSSEITRTMFHAIEEILIKHKEKAFLTLLEVEENDELFKNIINKIHQLESDLRTVKNIKNEDVLGEDINQDIKKHLRYIHHNTIEKFISIKNVKDFADKCKELLVFIFNHTTARFHPLFYPFSDSFLLALNSISKSLKMKDIIFENNNSYFNFFNKYIMTLYTPFEGTPLKGLQVLGFLETRNLDFENVFVLDMNQDVMPDSNKEDTLLPYKIRQSLGLPTYKDRDKLMAYYFETLIGGAKEVHLFFIENDKKERSGIIEKLIWEKQKNSKKTDSKLFLSPIQYDLALKNTIPGDISKTQTMVEFLKAFTYSATALDKYLTCPLKFYYSYVLNLKKRDEISSDIERGDIGKFVHDVMTKYFSKRVNKELNESDISIDEMDALINKLFKEKYGGEPVGATYLLKIQIKNHLKDFLKEYYIPLIRNDSVTIIGCEKNIQISNLGFSGNLFNLKARLDSIEKRGDKTIILDFKTSSKSDDIKIRLDKLNLEDRESWSSAIGSIQLPFYIMLYSEYAKVNISDLNGMFLLLGRLSLKKDNIEVLLFTCSNKETEYECLKKIIFLLLQEIVDVNIPFKPSSNKKKSCPNCNFKHICGTQWLKKGFP